MPQTDAPVKEKPVADNPDRRTSAAKAFPEPKLPLATIQKPAKIKPTERILPPVAVENKRIPAKPVLEEALESDVSGNQRNATFKNELYLSRGGSRSSRHSF